MTRNHLRILVNDHSGHPFQVQLSRALARRGHCVLHTYSESFQTPKGPLSKRHDDPETFQVKGITLSDSFDKYSFLRRRFQEREYASILCHLVDRFQPQVLLSSNTPLDAQALILAHCRARGVKYIFWVQDIYSIAIRKILKRKLPFVGAPVAAYYERLEQKQFHQSNAIVLITDDFIPLAEKWANGGGLRIVIPNWAPLEELRETAKDNSWSRFHQIHDKTVLLYSGTLGFKHNPQILLSIAQRFSTRPNVAVVVISEGPGANWLQEKKKELMLNNLKLLGYQSFEQLPEVLSTADIFITILEKDAGVFSVPSKVLTYMCFQRPQLLAVPRENLAARIITSINAGRVVSPDDLPSILAAMEELLDNQSLRATMALNARDYANKHFDISRITDEFEGLIYRVCAN